MGVGASGATVTIVSGSSSSAVRYLTERGQFFIGTGSEADIRLRDDPRVASLHAEIRLEEGQWILIRCTVRNSLTLNGHKVECPLPLRSGDEIVAGKTKLRFDDPAREKRPARQGFEATGHTGGETECWHPTGSSLVVRNFVETLRRFAASDESVLLLGETGTGKEVAARAIHEFSARRNNPFVVVNCPALPSSLVESELFGIERGVATGVEARTGLLESANRGTLFLDEVGDLEAAAQAKLLRFLQERTINTIGGRSKLKLDVRIIAATHHDLDDDVAAGRFRLDLHYRLKVLMLRVPSLRERIEDIPLLIEEFRSKCHEPAPTFAAETLRVLQAYSWPGNVRELQHLVKSLDVLVNDREILPEHLPPEVRCRGRALQGTLHRRVVEDEGCFWELVQKPFLRHELSRDDVRCFIAQVFDEAGRSYVNLARMLRIEKDYKKFLDFLGRHDLGVGRTVKASRARRAPDSGATV